MRTAQPPRSRPGTPRDQSPASVARDMSISQRHPMHSSTNNSDQLVTLGAEGSRPPSDAFFSVTRRGRPIMAPSMDGDADEKQHYSPPPQQISGDIRRRSGQGNAVVPTPNMRAYTLSPDKARPATFEATLKSAKTQRFSVDRGGPVINSEATWSDIPKRTNARDSGINDSRSSSVEQHIDSLSRDSSPKRKADYFNADHQQDLSRQSHSNNNNNISNTNNSTVADLNVSGGANSSVNGQRSTVLLRRSNSPSTRPPPLTDRSRSPMGRPPLVSASVVAAARSRSAGPLPTAATPPRSPTQAQTKRVIVAVPIGKTTAGASPLRVKQPTIVANAESSPHAAHQSVGTGTKAAPSSPSKSKRDGTFPTNQDSSDKSYTKERKEAGGEETPSASPLLSTVSGSAHQATAMAKYHAMYKEQVKSARLWRNRALELEAQGLALLKEKERLEDENKSLLADMERERARKDKDVDANTSGRQTSPSRNNELAHARRSAQTHDSTVFSIAGTPMKNGPSRPQASTPAGYASELDSLVFAHLGALEANETLRSADEAAFVKRLAEEERRTVADLLLGVAAMLDVAEGTAASDEKEGDIPPLSRRAGLISAIELEDDMSASAPSASPAQKHGTRLAAYSDLLEDFHEYVLTCKLQTAGAIQTTESVKDVLQEVIEALQSSAKMLFQGNRKAAGARRSVAAMDLTRSLPEAEGSPSSLSTPSPLLYDYVRSQQEEHYRGAEKGSVTGRGQFEEPSQSPSPRGDRKQGARSRGSSANPSFSSHPLRSHIATVSSALESIEKHTEGASDVLRGCVQGVRAVLVSLEEKERRDVSGPYGAPRLRLTAQDILDEIQKDIIAFKNNSASTIKKLTHRLGREQEAHRRDCEVYRSRLMTAEREYTKLLMSVQRWRDSDGAAVAEGAAFGLEHLKRAYLRAVNGEHHITQAQQTRSFGSIHGYIGKVAQQPQLPFGNGKVKEAEVQGSTNAVPYLYSVPTSFGFAFGSPTSETAFGTLDTPSPVPPPSFPHSVHAGTTSGTPQSPSAGGRREDLPSGTARAQDEEAFFDPPFKKMPAAVGSKTLVSSFAAQSSTAPKHRTQLFGQFSDPVTVATRRATDQSPMPRSAIDTPTPVPTPTPVDRHKGGGDAAASHLAAVLEAAGGLSSFSHSMFMNTSADGDKAQAHINHSRRASPSVSVVMGQHPTHRQHPYAAAADDHLDFVNPQKAADTFDESTALRHAFGKTNGRVLERLRAGAGGGAKGPATIGGLAAMRERLQRQRVEYSRVSAALASGHRSVSQTIVSPSEDDE